MPKDTQTGSSDKFEIKRNSFIVMEKLGKTLKDHLIQNKQQLSHNAVCDVGIQLIEQLMQIHAIGKVYNDLKLENILVDYDIGHN